MEKFRLLAARMRKEGKSIREIAYGLCKPYSTVRDWLLRMHVYGPKGRFNRKRRGRRRMLGNADLKRLKPVAGRYAGKARIQVLILAV